MFRDLVTGNWNVTFSTNQNIEEALQTFSGKEMDFTNETAEMFDLNCLDCGQPVAMKYNVKKKRYETIRE